MLSIFLWKSTNSKTKKKWVQRIANDRKIRAVNVRPTLLHHGRRSIWIHPRCCEWHCISQHLLSAFKSIANRCVCSCAYANISNPRFIFDIASSVYRAFIQQHPLSQFEMGAKIWSNLQWTTSLHVSVKIVAVPVNLWGCLVCKKISTLSDTQITSVIYSDWIVYSHSEVLRRTKYISIDTGILTTEFERKRAAIWNYYSHFRFFINVFFFFCITNYHWKKK